PLFLGKYPSNFYRIEYAYDSMKKSKSLGIDFLRNTCRLLFLCDRAESVPPDTFTPYFSLSRLTA
ncbi:hypothetical protein, partial [Streptococcus suis]|uniref:hypothetical protein n=1 Tax=Streptococcus suis TaxID=1307 RepID=UPI001EE72519